MDEFDSRIAQSAAGTSGIDDFDENFYGSDEFNDDEFDQEGFDDLKFE